MNIAIMSVKIQTWSILNTLVLNHKFRLLNCKFRSVDTAELENFLDSRLSKELLPFISAAF